MPRMAVSVAYRSISHVLDAYHEQIASWAGCGTNAKPHTLLTRMSYTRLARASYSQHARFLAKLCASLAMQRLDDQPHKVRPHGQAGIVPHLLLFAAVSVSSVAALPTLPVPVPPSQAPRPSLHACPVALRPFARHTAAPLHTPCFARFAHSRASLQAQDADHKLIELTASAVHQLCLLSASACACMHKLRHSARHALRQAQP